MTTSTTPDCPECRGLQMVGHPAGILAIRHSNHCELRQHEDARQVADKDIVSAAPWRRRFVRPSTPTERVLLGAVLGSEIPSDAETFVEFLSPGTRGRYWDLDGGGLA